MALGTKGDLRSSHSRCGSWLGRPSRTGRRTSSQRHRDLEVKVNEDSLPCLRIDEGDGVGLGKRERGTNPCRDSPRCQC